MSRYILPMLLASFQLVLPHTLRAGPETYVPAGCNTASLNGSQTAAQIASDLALMGFKGTPSELQINCIGNSSGRDQVDNAWKMVVAQARAIKSPVNSAGTGFVPQGCKTSANPSENIHNHIMLKQSIQSRGFPGNPTLGQVRCVMNTPPAGKIAKLQEMIAGIQKGALPRKEGPKMGMPK